MADFTHLHVHSHYSLLDGLGKIKPLVARAHELNMSAVALTDHGAMYGIIEFVQEAQKVGIKPIVGVELYLAPLGHTQKRGKIDSNPRHLTVLAHNNHGYKNLLKLVTIAHLKGFYYKPRIDYSLLEQYSEGLIVLSGCINGDIPQAILSRNYEEVERLIKWHLRVFGRDRFYLEVQSHPTLSEQNTINEALLAMGKKHRVGIVATADSHYIHPEDAEAQDVLICVQTGKKVSDKDRLCMLGEDFSLKTPDELKKAWAAHGEALDNTMKIADMCNVSFAFGVNQLPTYPLPPDTSSDEALRSLCEKGLEARYGKNMPPDTSKRLDYELDVIKKTGFAPYFLIVADFVNEAKQRAILVGPGRGSAAGSLVSYLTNITNIDPLRYDLLFERFLNPDRVSMPDIDLDFADDRRDEVIEYVRNKYGYDHVAQIITFGTMAARAAVRDAGRALGMPYSFCDAVAKSIPPFMDFEEALSQSPELKELYAKDPQAVRLIDMAKKLEGVCRHASTHAAGIVITQKPIDEYVPVQLSSTAKGDHDTVTQYAMKEVEALGLLKIDFLGLKNLTIIQNTLHRIEKRYGIKIDLDHLPLDDAKSYQLLQAGQTTGVFQLESTGMKRYLKELKPTEFEDIMSMVALYRPGPMDSIPDFIAGKHKRKKVTYLHPSLEPILEKTYGVIVTQDQVLQIARSFSGFTYAEADILRKAVGKKIKALLDEQREKFIAGAIKHSAVNKTLAANVWDFIEPFARYGFNRAHAACYAMIAYQTAYLKANYPAEFMAALLTSDQGNIDRAAIEVAEALSMNLKILPPHLNESDHDFTVVSVDDGKAIRFGLAGIKNVGDPVIDAIITERAERGPFTDIADLFRRISNHSFNRKSVESLIRSGALDCLGERNYLLHNLEKLLEFNRTLHRQHDQGQQGLFGPGSLLPPPTPQLAATTAATKEERLHWEKELVGMYVSEHPLSEWRHALSDAVTPTTELNEQVRALSVVRVAGVISQLTKIITKNQQNMLFVQLEDLVGSVEAVIFPSVLNKSPEQWVIGALVIVEGKVSEKEGERKLLVETVWPLTHETLARIKRKSPSTLQPKSCLIRLPGSFSQQQLKALHALLSQQHHDGGLMVELLIPHEGRLQRIKTSYRLPITSATRQELEKIVGSAAVQYT